jgi:hypothetical protein
MRWRWLRLHVCNVFNLFEDGKRVQVFDHIFASDEFTLLSWFNASGLAANILILLACYLYMFDMV